MILGASAVLLIAVAVGVAFESQSAKVALLQKFSLTAKLLASTSRSAVAFEDSRRAAEIVAFAEATDSVSAVEIRLASGKVLAGDVSVSPVSERQRWRTDGTAWSSDFLFVKHPIELDGEHLGEVVVAGLRSDIDQTLKTAVAFLATAGILLALITAIGSSWLRRLVITPVRRLAETMQLISRQRSYGQRVTVERNDEISVMYESFNVLLDELQKGQRHIEGERARLENQVKLATAELRDANGQLEGRIDEVTVARREAERAVRAKADFLANMSHEIRTPMNGVLGMLELLGDTPLSNQQQQLASTARQSAGSLLAIINDILDLSKIDAGKMSLESIDVIPGELIEEVVALLAKEADRKDLELVALLPAVLFDTYSLDPVRFRQLLTNLIGNAIKFTRAGSVTVRAQIQANDSTSGSTATAQSLVVDVIDTGVGIPKEAHATLFEAFTQADSSTTREFGGTGLGLAITREITALFGGNLTFESAEGEGSTFTATLALPQSTESADAPLVGIRVRHELSGALAQSLEHTLQSLGASVEQQPEIATDFTIIRASGELTVRATGSSEATGSVALPLRRASLLAALSTESPASAARITASETAVRPHFESARVLVVEDNLVNQKVAAGMLKRYGIESVLAEDGRAGVERWSEAAFDLVLMDCQMPELDGYQATAEIRELERARGTDRTPIVALTANAMRGDAERCLASGMDAYLAKPLRMRELEAALKRFLSAS